MHPPLRCVKCGYDLRGAGERCPECGIGLDVDPRLWRAVDEAAARWRAARWLLFVGALWLSLVVVVFCVSTWTGHAALAIGMGVYGTGFMLAIRGLWGLGVLQTARRQGLADELRHLASAQRRGIRMLAVSSAVVLLLGSLAAWLLWCGGLSD